jgi:linoleoyl-CoA desaturase
LIENLEIQIQPDCRHDESETRPRLKFKKSDGFHIELRRRVDAFFESTERRPRDCWQMYCKTAILLTIYAATYVLLIFFAQTAWQALPLAVLLGLATAAIGFNVQHDAGHHAYSSRPWINKLMAMTLDLIGGSSYVWHWKHAVFHHTYANVTGYDADIEIGIFGRLSPHQKWRPLYRWQHIYLWPLYGLLAIQWQLQSDFYEVLVGRIGHNRFPRPKGWNLAIFLAGKAVFFCLAFVTPLLYHSLWTVIAYYAIAAVTLGITLSIVFQLAHVVEHADFPLPAAGTAQIENEWAVHQVETTVDFARHSRIAAWLLGGLNFQIEHHLFPRICHVHYPAISSVVEATCRDFGIRYTEHPTIWSGLVSHFRWLRKMGSK